MSMKAKRHYTARDRLAAYLVLLIVFVLILISAIVLYMTGIFTPVSGEVSLSDTEPLVFDTAAPAQSSLLDFLFSSARAEAEGEAPVIETEADLEVLLAQIAGEQRGEDEITEADQIVVDKKDLAINKNLPADWYNVLLLATDSRDVKMDNGRTDVMIIASIHQTTGEIKLSSIARDLYVEIPGTNTSNRINTAYAFGRANLAMKTINSVFELNVQNYVCVNFQVMADIIDLLGGVDIQLYDTEYMFLNAIVAVGEDYEGFGKTPSRKPITEQDIEAPVHLDGLQAVAYARIRKSDNDLQRSSRQRVLLQAMLNKAMDNATISTLLGLFSSISKTADTNIVVSKMLDIGSLLLLSDSFTLEEFSVPMAESYSYVTVQSSKGTDMLVLKTDIARNTRALHEFIYGEYIPAEAK